jgi:Ca2+-binding RTX toxin-like protein
MRRALAVVAMAATGLLPMPATAQTPPQCFGRTATIVGTEGDDTISGTTGTDVIVALDGTDFVLGWHDPEPTYPYEPTLPDEMDYICGGANAGEGGGGDPDESLRGGYGRDRIAGGGGADSLVGGKGNDVLMGGSSQDSLSGEGGHDRIYGDGGDEIYYNQLVGGNGDDYLEGRLGVKDRFFGGSGYDTCVMGPEDVILDDRCEEIIPA